MDYNGKPHLLSAVFSGLFSLYWALLSLVIHLCYRPCRCMAPLLVHDLSTYHICVYLWGVIAACFYFCAMLFNITGHEALQVLAYLFFSVYMGWVYFVGLGISCGYTWRVPIQRPGIVFLTSTSLLKFTVSLLAFSQVNGLLYFISAFNIILFFLQLICVYSTMRRVAEELGATGRFQAEQIFLKLIVIRLIFVTLSLLFGIECVGTYMVYGDGMDADNAVYFVCFALTNSIVQSMLMWIARPKQA